MSDAHPDAVWRSRLEWNADGSAQAQALSDTWDRLALAVSAAETQQRDLWQQRFRALLEGQGFLPSKQMLHAAGLAPHAQLASCFAVAPMANSLHGVLDALHDSLVCLHAGADVGVDFSNVLPSIWPGFGSDPAHIGPGPFANLWSVASSLLGRGNGHAGRVAMTLRCDHPDIASFVEALPARGADPHLEAAVLVSDAFMQAVQQGAEWPLVFPLQDAAVPAGAQVLERVWPGRPAPQPCRVHRTVKAQTLWVRLLQAQHAFGSPRLLFEDAMQGGNSLWYVQQLYTASPGGSVALSVDAGCVCGSLNLAQFVRHSANGKADVAWEALQGAAALAVRFLDDAHSVCAFPQPRLARSARATRCIGLGVTGLASLLGTLGLDYGAPASLELTEKIMAAVRDAAYQMSIDLAREKGAFPAFDALRHGAAAVVLDLPHALQDGIARHGLRNSQLLAVGTDALQDALAQQRSHGAEPQCPPDGTAVPAALQLEMASRVQRCVDNGVSVTLHVPQQTPAVAYDAWLQQAWRLRLKNALVLRSN